MICFGRKLASGTGAEDVLDWVGHNNAPKTLLVLLEFLMTCTPFVESS
jgi:hypothetical protein